MGFRDYCDLFCSVKLCVMYVARPSVFICTLTKKKYRTLEEEVLKAVRCVVNLSSVPAKCSHHHFGTAGMKK